MVLPSKFFDSSNPFDAGPSEPVPPLLIGVPESLRGHHPLDRLHSPGVPAGWGVLGRVSDEAGGMGGVEFAPELLG